MSDNFYIKELMESLTKQLLGAARAYYNGIETDELMTDAQYDNMLIVLAGLERQYPQYKYVDEEGNSPTTMVGYGPISESLERVKHPKKMLSLDKLYDIEEVVDFFAGMYPVVGSLKADGLTIVTTYESKDEKSNSYILDAITRGDGLSGDRVFSQICATNIPKAIDFKGRLVVRHEAVITRECFESINAKLPEGEKYKNPRNLVSGTVRNLDPSVVFERGVKLKAFEIVEIEPAAGYSVPKEVFESDLSQRKWLESLGFDMVEYQLLNTKEEVSQYHDYVQDLRIAGYEFDTDGIVFCVDSIKDKKRLGVTAKHPKYSIAFKFPNKGEVSVVNSIVWQRGMFKLTPVVNIEALEFDGVTVSRATAHNLSFVLGKDDKGNIVRPPVTEGASIRIERGGEVIPKISEVYYAEDGSFPDALESLYPHECPDCGSPTSIVGVDLICTNVKCRGRLKAIYNSIVSRDCLNIQSFGERTIDTLMRLGYLKQPGDLFALEKYRNELIKLEGYGETSIDKLLAEIEKAKDMPLPNILSCLCIKGIGLEVAKKVASILKDGLISLLTVDKEELLALDGIGEILANNILAYVSDSDSSMFIHHLIYFGYGVESYKDTELDSTKLQSKVVCITGTLSRERSYFEELVRSNGGKVVSSVSSKCSFVVLGSNAGKSKVDGAQKNGVPMISEQDFMDMLK